MTTLEFILQKQKEFQQRLGYNEGADLQERVHLIHTHAHFLNEEVYEMLRELPYHKPWKKYELTEDQEKEMLKNAQKEYIDVLCFFINIAIFLEMDVEKILKGYIDKNELNNQRQEDKSLGYV